MKASRSRIEGLRWEPRDPLLDSALPHVAGIVIEPLLRHATTLDFTVLDTRGMKRIVPRRSPGCCPQPNTC